MEQILPWLEGVADAETTAVGSVMHMLGELIAPEVTLGEAASILDRLQRSSLLIAVDGELQGIMTLHDLAKAVRAGYGSLEPVRTFMSRDVITALESDSLAAAARLMSARGICHLPVRDAKGKLVGMLNTHDLRRQSAAALRVQMAHAKKLEKVLEETLLAMAAVMEQRDPYTAGHQKHVGELAVSIGKELGFDEERLRALNLAAIVHDLGKIQIPVEILTKPARLNAAEFALVKRHPQAGYDILKTIDFPWPIADIVVQHHECLDGSGYPRGLKGAQIMQEARVLTVADIVESMSSDRPYRAALGIDAAIAEITRLRGSKLDADVVDACIRVLQRNEFSPNLLQLAPDA